MPRRLHRSFLISSASLLLAVSAICTARAAASEAQPEELALTADEPLEIDGRTGEIIARGNARVIYKEWTLTADEIRVNQGTRDAEARGHVIATRPGLRLLANVARMRQQDGHLEVEDFRFGQPPFYASGRRGYGTAEAMTFEDVDLYYGEPGKLTPHAAVRLLRIDRNADTVNARGLRLSIGSIPVLAMSGLTRPLAGPKLNWENRAGYESNLGVQLGASAYYPSTNGFNPGGSVDVFTSRGILFGPGARYDLARENSRVEGGGDLLYIDDGGDRRTDILGEPIGRDRFIGAWKHQQQGADRWTLNGELNWWSDSAVLRDFRENAFDRNQEPDNFLEASWYGANYVLSAFSRFRPNDYFPVAERFPEVRFDLLPTPLADTGALLRSNASAASLRERTPGGGPALRSDRFDLYAGLSRTFTVARGVTFTPVAGGELTHYARAGGGRDDYTRWLGEIGFDARLHASRVKEMEKPLWGIDGLRHIVEPALEYRYVPSADRGRAFIPEIDRPAFLTQLQPLGLADRRDIDAFEEIHVVRAGIGNIIQTRREDYGSRQLLSFSLASDIYLSDRPDGRDSSDIHLEVRLTPADWLDWWFFVRTDPRTFAVREFNTRLTLADGEAWSIGLDGDYLQNEISQVEVFGRYELNEADEIFAALRYDAREHRFNEITLGLQRQIAQNWVVRAGAVVRDGPRRESSFGLRLNLSFLAF